MRVSFFALPLLVVAVACGGSESGGGDSAASTPSAAPSAASPSSAPAAAVDSGAIPRTTPELPAPNGAPAPVVGTVIEVRMLGDAKGYRFEPSHITAHPGDGIKFLVVSGGPHEIAFDLDRVPQETKLQLLMNMPNGANGRSPLLSAPQETWTLSLTGLKPGSYPFYSTPRLPQGMKGEIEIK